MSSVLQALVLLTMGTVVFPTSLIALQYCWKYTQLGLKIKRKLNLSEKDCADISVKTISAIQALFASVTGAIVCFKCHQDVLYCSHPILMIYAWFGTPYFIYDALAMFYVSNLKEKQSNEIKQGQKKHREFFKLIKKFLVFASNSPMIIIHHLIMAPIGFFIIVYFRGVRGDFFIAVMFLMEVSTPFVSCRFILSKLKMKSTMWYKLNGAFMLITFPICRIFSVLYTTKMYAEQQGTTFQNTFFEMHPLWLFVYLASISLQIYWYGLMCAGLIKMMKQKKHSQSD